MDNVKGNSMTSIEEKRKELAIAKREGNNLIDDNRHLLHTKSFKKKWARHEERVENLLFEVYYLERKEKRKTYTLRSLYFLAFIGTIAFFFINISSK